MHPITTMKHWGQHVNEHLHSRHFWAGVGITLLIIGFVALLFFAVKTTPLEWQGIYPYVGPYVP